MPTVTFSDVEPEKLKVSFEDPQPNQTDEVILPVNDTAESNLAAAIPEAPEFQQGAAYDQGLGNSLINLATGLPNLPNAISQIPKTMESGAYWGADKILQGAGLLGAPVDEARQGLANAPRPMAGLVDSNPLQVPKITPILAKASGFGDDITPEQVRANLSSYQKGTNYEDELRVADRRTEVLREENPGTFFGGEVTGDILGLAAGRAPFTKAQRAAEIAAQKGITRAARKSDQSAGFMTPKAAAKDFVASPTLAEAKRGISRGGEAFIEGAVLGAQQRNDPLEVGSMTAGAQAGAGTLSRLLSTSPLPTPIGRFLRQHRSLGLVTNAIGIAGAIQAAKALIPGGRDWWTESVESGFQKAALFAALGAASGAVSGRAGRHGTGTQGRLGAIGGPLTDAAFSVPRNFMQSMISRFGDFTPEEGAQFEAGINTLAQKPEAILESQHRRLQRYQRAGNGKKFAAEIIDIGKPKQ